MDESAYWPEHARAVPGEAQREVRAGRLANSELMPPRHLPRFAALAVSVVAAVSPVVFVCGAATAARTVGLARAKAERATAIAASATQPTGPATSPTARRPKALASPRPTRPTGAGRLELPTTTAAPSVTQPSPSTTSTTSTTAAPTPNTTSCEWALAYLRANAAPGSTLECPGSAFGHQAVTLTTCDEGGCSNRIIIHDVCAASVMNEAWNSRHPSGPIDPYGHC
jgi:hypothetical protein